MIVVSELCIAAGDFSLTGVSFRVEAGEYAAVMGRTGAGKTSVVECICGLRPITSGRIELDERDVSDAHPAERNVGYVPQDGALFTTMTVRDNLTFSLEIRKWKAARIRERLDELVALLGISHLLARRPIALSGGEKQRVALGRALAFRPSILCLDEPLSALDETTRSEMYELLRTIRRQTQVTTLHVTHSVSEASTLADSVLILEEGSVRKQPIAEFIAGSRRPPEEISENSD